jgi:hypothetical protein
MTNRWATERTWEQMSAEDNLGRYPYRLEVRGSTRSLTWPDVCAHCGALAMKRIRVRKAYYRHGRGRRYPGFFGYRVVSADVPFCGPCVVRHRETLPHVSVLRRLRTFLLNPGHIATIGFSVLLALTLPSVLTMPLTTTEGKVAWQAWAFPGIFVFGLVWTVCVTWLMTRPDRFEPRTEITLACDFSHDVSQFFEGRRHIYAFRNGTFAAAFERANQARIWTASDQSRMWRKSLVATILLIVVIGGARLLLWYYEGR